MPNTHGVSSDSPSIRGLKRQLSEARRQLETMKQGIHTEAEATAAVGFTPGRDSITQDPSSHFQRVCRHVGSTAARIASGEIQESSSDSLITLLEAARVPYERILLNVESLYPIMGRFGPQSRENLLEIVSKRFIADGALQVFSDEIQKERERENELESLQIKAGRSLTNFKSVVGSEPMPMSLYNNLDTSKPLFTACHQAGKEFAERDLQKAEGESIEKQLSGLEHKIKDAHAALAHHKEEHDMLVDNYGRSKEHGWLHRIVIRLSKYYIVKARLEVLTRRNDELKNHNPHRASARTDKDGFAHVLDHEREQS